VAALRNPPQSTAAGRRAGGGTRHITHLCQIRPILALVIAEHVSANLMRALHDLGLHPAGSNRRLNRFFVSELLLTNCTVAVAEWIGCGGGQGGWRKEGATRCMRNRVKGGNSGALHYLEETRLAHSWPAGFARTERIRMLRKSWLMRISCSEAHTAGAAVVNHRECLRTAAGGSFMVGSQLAACSAAPTERDA
jgi:hypothetical protein